MKTGRIAVIGRMIVSLVLTGLALSLVSFGASAAIAAEVPVGSVKLPSDGGEPGRAYMAYINAAYRKDHKQLCRSMADPAEVEQCLQQKAALDGYIAMLTQPKSHRVLGGSLKGDEATLEVAYQHEGAPENTGIVVMKKTGSRWAIASFGGSGSTTVSAEASGTADLAAGAGTDPGFAVITITPSPKGYTGRCPATIAFTADITFKTPLPEKFSYRWEFSNGTKTPDRVVKPQRNGRLSVREVWRGGKAGEEHDAAARFVAEAGDAQMILDPPGVKVICK